MTMQPNEVYQGVDPQEVLDKLVAKETAASAPLYSQDEVQAVNTDPANSVAPVAQPAPSAEVLAYQAEVNAAPAQQEPKEQRRKPKHKKRKQNPVKNTQSAADAELVESSLKKLAGKPPKAKGSEPVNSAMRDALSPVLASGKVQPRKTTRYLTEEEHRNLMSLLRSRSEKPDSVIAHHSFIRSAWPATNFLTLEEGENRIALTAMRPPKDYKSDKTPAEFFAYIRAALVGNKVEYSIARSNRKGDANVSEQPARGRDNSAAPVSGDVLRRVFAQGTREELESANLFLIRSANEGRTLHLQPVSL